MIYKKTKDVIFWIECIIKLGVIAGVIFSSIKLSTAILTNRNYYLSSYYDEKYYKFLEDSFNRSQYRLKNPTSLIPDETVFGYAAGALVHGVDPILINSETTPLGKYFIGLSILIFKNDRLVVLFFGLFSLIVLFFLSKETLFWRWLIPLPVVIFSSERLFIDQFLTAPLLDIIQLPFVLLCLYFFVKNNILLTVISLGLVMSTKSVIPAVLLVLSFSSYYILQKNYKELLIFFIYLPLSVFILAISYVRTFLNGYSWWDFFRFQKWIIQYQQSKLIFPLSVWRLIFLNQWQAWWGDMRILRAQDWSINWPIFTTLSATSIVLLITRKIKANRAASILSLWLVIYGTFLSLGVVSSRFLLQFLPVSYILGIFLIRNLFLNKFKQTE